MTSRLKSNRRGWEKLKKRLLRFDERSIDIGFFRKERYDDQDLYVGEVAYMNDQGTSAVPPRPFMTVDFVDYASSNFKKDVKELLRKLLMSPNVAYVKELEAIGEKYAHTLRNFIFDYPGSNSPRWIEEKGFNDPLYHTGTMVNAVDFRIKRKRHD